MKTTLHARSLFDGLQPENKTEQKTFTPEKDKTLDALVKCFGKVLRFRRYTKNKTNELYERIVLTIPEAYSAADICHFSLLSGSSQSEHQSKVDSRLGLYLSALINNSYEETFALHLRAGVEPHLLGYKNSKSIEIHGNVGIDLGMLMTDGEIKVSGTAARFLGNRLVGGKICVQSAEDCVGEKMHGGDITVMGNVGQLAGNNMYDGTLTIHGNAGPCLGSRMRMGIIRIHGNVSVGVGSEMNGGYIVVDGNAGDRVGGSMKNGSITIKGNAGNNVGVFMDGGSITLEGNYGSLSEKTLGGSIYAKGELVIQDGKHK